MVDWKHSLKKNLWPVGCALEPVVYHVCVDVFVVCYQILYFCNKTLKKNPACLHSRGLWCDQVDHVSATPGPTRPSYHSRSPGIQLETVALTCTTVLSRVFWSWSDLIGSQPWTVSLKECECALPPQGRRRRREPTAEIIYYFKARVKKEKKKKKDKCMYTLLDTHTHTPADTGANETTLAC